MKSISKRKVKKISLRWQILVPAIILVVTNCIVLGTTSKNRLDAGMTKQAGEQTLLIAQNVARTIDGNMVERLIEGNDSSTYEEVLASLRELKEEHKVEYLYILTTDGSRVYYGIDSDDSENQAAPGDVYVESYETLKMVFDGSVYTASEIDKSEDGNLITAYTPLKNETGDVVAILGCDYNADHILADISALTDRITQISISCILFSVVVLTLIINHIMKNLNAVEEKIYDLVNNEGDLTQKLHVKTGDELEIIADDVNQLLEYIRNIMLNISKNAEELTNSANTIVKHLSGAEVDISDVSATMQQMSAAMEETSASLSQINESVNASYMAAETISDKAKNGREMSGEVMKKAEDIYIGAEKEQESAKAKAKVMGETVTAKIEKSKAVEEISVLTEKIISITEQTNLLSLNASIEAARAGEAGRGFAVVADEIGKLAANSAETATEIQKVSEEVIAAVNELATESGQMLHFMNETAMVGYEKLLSTCTDYKDSVKALRHMMREFADESASLKENMDVVKEAVEAVNIAVEESANGINSVTETSVNLTTGIAEIGNEAKSNEEIAGSLTGEVNKFKLY